MAELDTFTPITRAKQYDGDNAADIIAYINDKLGTSNATTNADGTIVNDESAVVVGAYVVEDDQAPHGFRVLSEAAFEHGHAPTQAPA